MKHRLVDKILGWQTFQDIRGSKVVSFEEYQLKAAFGGDDHLPESLVLESLFQLGNWLIVLSTDYRQMGIVTEFDSVHFFEILKPGQRLTLEVQVGRYDSQSILFEAHGSAGATKIVRIEGCEAQLVDLTEYHNPDDFRVLYSEIGPIVPDYSFNRK